MTYSIVIKYWDGSVLYTHTAVGSDATILRALETAAKDGADLSGAVLRGADLRGADLSGAVLSDADLRGADLSGAVLRGAYLNGADLREAELGGADLRGADLSGADLNGADLREAVLNGAFLRGAVLYGVTITRRPLAIEGLRWPIMVFDGHMKIGCQIHKISEWAAFDDEAIFAMAGRVALRFWRENKEWLLKAAAPFA